MFYRFASLPIVDANDCCWLPILAPLTVAKTFRSLHTSTCMELLISLYFSFLCLQPNGGRINDWGHGGGGGGGAEKRFFVFYCLTVGGGGGPRQWWSGGTRGDAQSGAEGAVLEKIAILTVFFRAQRSEGWGVGCPAEFLGDDQGVGCIVWVSRLILIDNSSYYILNQLDGRTRKTQVPNLWPTWKKVGLR